MVRNWKKPSSWEHRKLRCHLLWDIKFLHLTFYLQQNKCSVQWWLCGSESTFCYMKSSEWLVTWPTNKKGTRWKYCFKPRAQALFFCHYIAIKLQSLLSQLKSKAWDRMKIFFLKISINCKTIRFISPIIMLINKNHLNFLFRGMHKKISFSESMVMYSQILAWWQTKFRP